MTLQWCRKIFSKFEMLAELTVGYKVGWERYEVEKNPENLKSIQNLKKHINGSLKDFYKQLENIPISAVNPDGRLINIDFQQEKKYWQDFYNELKIKDENNDFIKVPDSLKLTFASKIRIKKCIKEYGFDYLMIIPPGISPNSLINNVKFSQYFDHNSGLYLEMSKNIDSSIEQSGMMDTVNKNWKVLFTKLKAKSDSLDNGDKIETEGKSFNQILKIEKTKNMNGMNILEFLIYSRNYFYEKEDLNDSPLMPFQENPPPPTKEKINIMQFPQRIWLTGEDILGAFDTNEGIIAGWQMSYDEMNDYRLDDETIKLLMDLEYTHLEKIYTGTVLTANLEYQI